MLPEMFDTPISLNLRVRLRDSYIAGTMSSLLMSGRQTVSCGCPPSFARRQIIGTGILGHNKRKTKSHAWSMALFMRRESIFLARLHIHIQRKYVVEVAYVACGLFFDSLNMIKIV